MEEKINRRIKNLQNLINEKENILSAAKIINNAIKNRSKIFFCGNGGSASDSNHLAAEFVARFKKERGSYPAISLCANNSTITAIANDYSFDDIFKRQIEGLASKNDVLIAISTSGKSKNVLNSIKQAKQQGLKTILLTGKNKTVDTDCTINAGNLETEEIQEIHIIIGHILAQIAEENL